MQRLVEVSRKALVLPVAPSRSTWMHDEGTDQYGRWCEFKVGDVVQRMRWIEPGTFWMGSPPNEPERADNELPHHVELTKGFWLADTACTQALWQEVMGSNPSHFNDDPQNPVECVSWNDVTDLFLPKLNEWAPGLNLQLPTEAQWEYACRAGTDTPFSFVKQITTDQVNYDGNWPYARGKKGKYRGKTVQVKALPANGWGLYQMHGNVWEWCSDEYRIDPAGRMQRVLRGGGWMSAGCFCRSTRRDARVLGDAPVHIGNLIGFRIARDLAD